MRSTSSRVGTLNVTTVRLPAPLHSRQPRLYTLASAGLSKCSTIPPGNVTSTWWMPLGGPPDRRLRYLDAGRAIERDARVHVAHHQVELFHYGLHDLLLFAITPR